MYCAAGKETQLCAPCETSADCGPLGAHTTLPDVLGGLPKGHILSAHYPTVCHHRACVPLQVPSKDGFCRALREAQQQTQHAAQHAHEQQQQHQPGFSLSSLAQKLYRPVSAQFGGRKAAQPSIPRRQLAGSAPAPAPSNQTSSQPRGTPAQPQGAAVSSGQPARSGNGAALVGGGQLSQSNGGNGLRGVYQTYTPAAPQRLSTQESVPTTSAASNPSLIDAGSAPDVTSNAQQQLRTAPTAGAATR